MIRPALILLAALVLRAPFFWVDVIDWDESTFILMGDAWAGGSLPYLELWDNKPPLCFAPFALVQLLFGKSIVAVRLLGAICVALAGLAMYRAGSSLRSENAGLIAGLGTVVLATFASRGQATMSETLAIAPLAWAALPHLTGRLTARSAFLSGLLLSVATLVRFNLAAVALVITLWA
ncbi:MAG: glycosyltransferase family 39 protein [Myxococcota bacterium]